MPFQSEKQRRYMHANLPGIAERWESKYGGAGYGGIKVRIVKKRKRKKP